ncbi:hypothetical protein Bpfe_007430 [Biomphalaria pfeifferi]|uniref:Uncharacterized protein n=1 Tax=Biomphalaria pfeifferi TaxID=112525 RepID=A0AAD8C0L3_BIOPF|nr:hypothetical protein Bpfe_007430 [Biomphalaria pfeifferi]
MTRKSKDRTRTFEPAVCRNGQGILCQQSVGMVMESSVSSLSVLSSSMLREEEDNLMLISRCQTVPDLRTPREITSFDVLSTLPVLTSADF